MLKDVKLYNIDENESEVFAISLVEEPAIEQDFVYLSSQKNLICLETNEKHMLYGCVLRPNFPIYRNQNGNEYYIQFSEKCIENLSKKFMKNGFQLNWTTDHNNEVEGVTVVESWLKADMEKDKSIALGLDPKLPIGSWFAGVSIENEEIWSSIKEGKWMGFSVEAFANLTDINKEINMQKENLEAIEITDGFWDKLRKIISDALGMPQKSEAVEKTVGEIVDEMEISGGSKDEKPQVVEMEVQEPTKEEAVIDAVEKVNEEVITEEDKAETLQAIVDELQAKVNALEGEIAKKDEEIAMLKEKAEKLSKQPSTEPINKNNKNENKISFLDYAQGKIRY